MTRLSRLLSSTIGAKFIVALTGLGLCLFVLGHMAGNLLIFGGPEAINSYAAGLKDTGPLLWVVRLGLLAVFATHVLFAIQLSNHNKEARPVRYGDKQAVDATVPSRTMIYTGVIILFFVVFHILHFTVGKIYPEFYNALDEKGRHDVYHMFVMSFRVPWVAFAYMGSMILLGMHLAHGTASIFQTLGLNKPRYRLLTTIVGRGFAGLILVGNTVMPLACLMGWLKLPGEAL